MRVEQQTWLASSGWSGARAPNSGAQLVMVFGGSEPLRARERLLELRQQFPRALLFGCSTAGEILDTRVTDDALAVSAITFDHSSVAVRAIDIGPGEDSVSLGRRLARELPTSGLVHVVVLSDGTGVNGTDLSRGLAESLPKGVTITGGLAGDGARFGSTWVLAGDEPRTGRVAALGLYGDRLRVAFASLGGWDAFGPERKVTRSLGNVLFELDGRPALELYKLYLGEHAKGLPSSGLLFPLSLRVVGESRELVRTILAVDEAQQSLTFAGDIPTGALARLMKANFDRLVDGAHGAATNAHRLLDLGSPELALLISCVGRKLVLKQRTEEEIEAVREVFGPSTKLTGFYSYGELCPAAPQASCELHNQTMTITALKEV